MAIFGFCQHLDSLKKKIWDEDITYPSSKVVTSLYSRVGDDFSPYDPYEAIQSSNGSLAQFFYEQEAKQK